MTYIHHEWGVGAALQEFDAAVIVDCLSFSTAVSVATAQNAVIYPFQFKQEAQRFADQMEFVCAQKRELGGISLSPRSLEQLSADEKIVLPSPNGASLSLFAKAEHVYCASLRNVKTVAQIIEESGHYNVLLISAGERWYDLDKTSAMLDKEDNRLRPCFEDMVASGAMIAHLSGELSPEAKIAKASFEAVQDNLRAELINSISGQELTARNFLIDVEYASMMNEDVSAPKLFYHDFTYGDLGFDEAEIVAQKVCYYKNVFF